MEHILERLTSNVFKGVLLGAVVTGLIQSSAATTVMCVGFVNAGIMKLEQTVGIIMGANIGTTVTAQLLRLGDIDADNIVMMFLQPSFLGPILAVVGIIFYMFIKGGHKRIVGQIVLGLGLLFIGMNTMSSAVEPLKDLPEFQSVFTAFSNPLLGVAVGAAVTALLQSSSASMGILQAISTTGVVSFNIAMPLIMGQNIGTCITALISSVGASKNAKRTAMIHLFFNIIGSVFFWWFCTRATPCSAFRSGKTPWTWALSPTSTWRSTSPVLPCFFPSTASSSSWSRRWCPATRRSGSCPCWTTVSCPPLPGAGAGPRCGGADERVRPGQLPAGCGAHLEI
ncbi:Na/Pi symporter [Flavonifractor plautii]|nr:Na/Pi symporter [Flavonifractor plautii]